MGSLPYVTVQAPGWHTGLWRYIEDPLAPFDLVCFDSEALLEQGLTDGVAGAGRGNTVFFKWHDQSLVLRHYRRGGLVRHVSQAHYVFTGWQKTRAQREFDMLNHVQDLNLPAPRPYACRVQRHGLLYTASLVTYRMAGKTLAEYLLTEADVTGKASDQKTLWKAVGELIARFHAAGVFHADLNAHNIIIDDGRVALLDFDRSRIRLLPAEPMTSGWCKDNMDRLHRSVRKLASSASSADVENNSREQGIAVCRAQWQHVLAARLRNQQESAGSSSRI